MQGADSSKVGVDGMAKSSGPLADPVEARVTDLRNSISSFVDRALTMRENTRDLRLRVWQARLGKESAYRGRDLLERVLDAAVSVASSDFANIQLLDPSGHRLVLAAHRGFDERFIKFFEVVNDRSSACGVAFVEKRPVAVPDVTQSVVFRGTRALEVLLDADVRAVCSVPLLEHGGQLLGVLSVHYRKPSVQKPSDVERLMALARSVASLIEFS